MCRCVENQENSLKGKTPQFIISYLEQTAFSKPVSEVLSEKFLVSVPSNNSQQQQQQQQQQQPSNFKITTAAGIFQLSLFLCHRFIDT